jgi:hypothetical protein
MYYWDPNPFCAGSNVNLSEVVTASSQLSFHLLVMNKLVA